MKRAAMPMRRVPMKRTSIRMKCGARLTVTVKQKRPSRRHVKPTAAEKIWMDRVAAFGCIACWLDGVFDVPPEVHHLKSGDRRMGHLFTIPLCTPHHRDTGKPGFVSRHPWKKKFEARYGTELNLLALLRQKLGEVA